jgi:excinuclease ABC subunit C
MQEELKKKLKSLPVSPGIYFHKDKNGEVIYVGKAAVLRNRVRHYFQNTKNRDVKTQALVDEIADTDWIETESEIDALFLESEMVKRYMPRYNILLRDDKSLIYIRVNTRDDWPYVSFTRNPADDGAEYMGPYFNSFAIRKALRYLRRIFPYYTKPVKSDDKPDLYEHMGWAPLGMSSREYKANIRRLVD